MIFFAGDHNRSGARDRDKKFMKAVEMPAGAPYYRNPNNSVPPGAMDEA